MVARATRPAPGTRSRGWRPPPGPEDPRAAATGTSDDDGFGPVLRPGDDAPAPRLGAPAPRPGARRLDGPAGSDRRRLLGWLGVGLAVRLLLMPFTASTDMLAVYWRSHLIAFDGTVFDTYLVNMGAHYVHAAALLAISVVDSGIEAVWTDPWWWSNSTALAPQVYREFVTRPDAYRTLFLLKVPYLLFDTAAGLAVLALVRDEGARARRRAWAFWMLSPIGIYAGYLFGRYEAFPVLFVVLALLAVERRRPWLGAMALGLAITMRSYPVLLVPVFALVAVPGWPRRLGWAGVSLLPLGLVMATNQVFASTVGELSRLRDFGTGATFFAYGIPVEGGGSVYVFFAGAFVLYAALLARQLGGWGDTPVGIRDLWVWLLVLHVAMFGLATFSAHWFTWLTPFVALALARRPQWRAVLPLHLAQVVAVLLIADLLGGSVLNVFAPLEPDLATTAPNLNEALLTSRSLGAQLEGLLRTAFVVASALLVLPALRELRHGRLRSGARPPGGAAARTA